MLVGVVDAAAAADDDDVATAKDEVGAVAASPSPPA